MFAREAARSTGLDVSLLGVVVAVVSFYADRMGSVAPETPHLVRFFDADPARDYAAVAPQDAALLLLVDPGTGGDGAGTATAAAATGAGDPVVSASVWTVLTVVGVAMILGGPAWAWYGRR